MPNHFHFLIHANADSVREKKVGSLKLQLLTNGFRSLLSSYSQAINKQENRTGSLFRQKTKFKEIERDSRDYDWTCFYYIHQNPVAANLVTKMEDWEYSSYRDHAGLKKDTICNLDLARKLLDLNEGT